MAKGIRHFKFRSMGRYAEFLTFGFIFLLIVGILKFVADWLLLGDFSIEIGALLAFVVAFGSEKISQSNRRISLKWSRFDMRRIAIFIVYIAIWIFAFAFSYQEILESTGMVKYLINMFVMYVFAGAFFEILNVLKRVE